MFLTRLALRS